MWLLSHMKDLCQGHGCKFRVKPGRIFVGFFLTREQLCKYSYKVGCSVAIHSERGAKELRIYTGGEKGHQVEERQ